MRDTCPSRVNSEIFVITPSGGYLAIATLLSLDASLAIPTRVLCSSPVRPVPTSQTGLILLHRRLRFFGLGFVDQPTNLVVFC
jgi:hypothetical protein